MNIQVCQNNSQERDCWNAFLVSGADVPDSFLQSWEWGEMQQAVGRKIYRVKIMAPTGQRSRLHGVVLLIVVPLPMGRCFLFTPRGPIVDDPQLFTALVQSDTMAAIIKETKAIFWRFEPTLNVDLLNAEVSDMSEFTEFKRQVGRVTDKEPSTTLLLELTRPITELLSVMKQKTRYNIRLAAKKGVQIEILNKNNGPDWSRLVEQFWMLLTETSDRHGIRHHTKEYYQTMFEVLGRSGLLEIAMARHNGDILAMNVNILFGDTVTYLHGAATHQKKNLMAPYALQWAVIQRAKAQGFRWYDFFGIGPSTDPTHPLQGVTRFKMGFGGQIVTFPGTWEFPFSPKWYTIYRTARRIYK